MIPVHKLISAPRESQMHGDSHDLRHGTKRRTSVEQILVPVLHPPMLGRRRSKAGQGKRGREHVLAEARIRVLGIEGIDQERVMGLDRAAWFVRLERRRGGHLARNPPSGDGAKRGLTGCNHAMYFILQSTSCQGRTPSAWCLNKIGLKGPWSPRANN